MTKQVVSLELDQDTGVLDLRLLTGEIYRITNAGHAQQVKSKVSVGGRLNSSQSFWLEQYRVFDKLPDRLQILAKLRTLREELKR